MKKLSIIFIVLSLFSCKDLLNKQENYLREQNKGKFSVDLSSPQFKVGETGIQFDSPYPFAPLRTIEATILYFPIEDAACLQFKLDTFTFHQFWSRESREAFIRGLEAYNRDFDAQKLGRNSRITSSMYGTANGYLIWRMSSVTIQAEGDMLFDIGYYFKERAPFFTITVGNAVFRNYSSPNDNEQLNSGERLMYLTKAQASNIAECFKQEYLQNAIPEAYRNLPAPKPLETVEYDAY